MRVLAKEDQKEVIVGTDFPNFKELLKVSGQSFQPTNWVLGKPNDHNDAVDSGDAVYNTRTDTSEDLSLVEVGEVGLAEEA